MKPKSLLVLGAIVAASACGGEKSRTAESTPAPKTGAVAPTSTNNQPTVSTTAPPVETKSTESSSPRARPKSLVDASAKILDASQFDDPRARMAYLHAKEIPDRLAKMHCYCECDTNPALRHTSLLSCYEGDHAAECGICQSEEEQAYKDWKAGRPVEDSIKAVAMMYGNSAMHM